MLAEPVLFLHSDDVMVIPANLKLSGTIYHLDDLMILRNNWIVTV